MGEPVKMRIGNAWPQKSKLATCGPRSPAVEPNCCPDIVCNLNIKIRTRGQHMHQNSSLPFVIVASTSPAHRCTGPRGAGFAPDVWDFMHMFPPGSDFSVCDTRTMSEHGRAGLGRATAGQLQGFVGLFGVAAGRNHSEPNCHLEHARRSPVFAA